MTATFSNYPYSMSGIGYSSALESGGQNKLSPYQLNSLATNRFGNGSSPMDIMHQAMNPYSNGTSVPYHNGKH